MRYGAANVTGLTTAAVNAPLAAIRAPATEMCKIREIGVTLKDAVNTRLGICRATTVSVTPGTTVAGQNHQYGAPASGSLLVCSWATAPVVATSHFRAVEIANAVGNGIIWTWPADDPLIVGNGVDICELVLVNLIAAGCATFRFYACWED